MKGEEPTGWGWLWGVAVASIVILGGVATFVMVRDNYWPFCGLLC